MKIQIGHNSNGQFVEDEEISPSERGYQFQFHFTRRLIERLSGFATVTLYDMKGNLITLTSFDKRGRDGGLDLLIRVLAATRTASRQVAGKVWKIIKEV